MNCLEVRRMLLQHPQSQHQHSLLRQHLDICPDCQQFAQQLLQQEQVLIDALHVSPPPHFADRILLNHQMHQRQRFWRPVMGWAAAVVLTISSMFFWNHGQSQPDWSEVVLAHVLNEQDTLQQQADISAQQLQQALAPFGVVNATPLGKIRYLDHCDMPGGKGLHVVLDHAQYGKITLIMIPRHVQNLTTQHLERDGFSARVLNIGATSLGLVTDQPQTLEAITAFMTQNLQPLTA